MATQNTINFAVSSLADSQEWVVFHNLYGTKLNIAPNSSEKNPLIKTLLIEKILNKVPSTPTDWILIALVLSIIIYFYRHPDVLVTILTIYSHRSTSRALIVLKNSRYHHKDDYVYHLSQAEAGQVGEKLDENQGQYGSVFYILESMANGKSNSGELSSAISFVDSSTRTKWSLHQ